MTGGHPIFWGHAGMSPYRRTEENQMCIYDMINTLKWQQSIMCVSLEGDIAVHLQRWQLHTVQPARCFIYLHMGVALLECAWTPSSQLRLGWAQQRKKSAKQSRRVWTQPQSCTLFF